MRTTIFIQNLKCGGCATTITNKLYQLLNLSDVVVNVDEASVTFSYLDDLDLHLVRETLKDSGYPEVGAHNNFSTKAKSYVSCAIGKLS